MRSSWLSFAQRSSISLGFRQMAPGSLSLLQVEGAKRTFAVQPTSSGKPSSTWGHNQGSALIVEADPKVREARKLEADKKSQKEKDAIAAKAAKDKAVAEKEAIAQAAQNKEQRLVDAEKSVTDLTSKLNSTTSEAKMLASKAASLDKALKQLESEKKALAERAAKAESDAKAAESAKADAEKRAQKEHYERLQLSEKKGSSDVDAAKIAAEAAKAAASSSVARDAKASELIQSQYADLTKRLSQLENFIGAEMRLVGSKQTQELKNSFKDSASSSQASKSCDAVAKSTEALLKSTQVSARSTEEALRAVENAVKSAKPAASAGLSSADASAISKGVKSALDADLAKLPASLGSAVRKDLDRVSSSVQDLVKGETPKISKQVEVTIRAEISSLRAEIEKMVKSIPTPVAAAAPTPAAPVGASSAQINELKTTLASLETKVNSLSGSSTGVQSEVSKLPQAIDAKLKSSLQGLPASLEAGLKKSVASELPPALKGIEGQLTASASASKELKQEISGISEKISKTVSAKIDSIPKPEVGLRPEIDKLPAAISAAVHQELLKMPASIRTPLLEKMEKILSSNAALSETLAKAKPGQADDAADWRLYASLAALFMAFVVAGVAFYKDSQSSSSAAGRIPPPPPPPASSSTDSETPLAAEDATASTVWQDNRLAKLDKFYDKWCADEKQWGLILAFAGDRIKDYDASEVEQSRRKFVSCRHEFREIRDTLEELEDYWKLRPQMAKSEASRYVAYCEHRDLLLQADSIFFPEGSMTS